MVPAQATWQKIPTTEKYLEVTVLYYGQNSEAHIVKFEHKSPKNELSFFILVFYGRLGKISSYLFPRHLGDIFLLFVRSHTAR